ncbi:Protein flp [Trichoderma lentiforme]|uniref:Protein flp n=1 Tax=Trichoderma lentiforme TaxID=1567552 RepID=A0A9P4X311_9HYPO|nr:Protein flp [Trichoderma lentiforme]
MAIDAQIRVEPATVADVPELIELVNEGLNPEGDYNIYPHNAHGAKYATDVFEALLKADNRRVKLLVVRDAEGYPIATGTVYNIAAGDVFTSVWNDWSIPLQRGMKQEVLDKLFGAWTKRHNKLMGNQPRVLRAIFFTRLLIDHFTSKSFNAVQMERNNVNDPSRSSDPYFNDEFNEKAQRLMDAWHVPGLAIGLIQGSSTSFKAYGLAQLPDIAVTPETVFFTASTTKAFTAASVSLLVDNADLRDDFALDDDSITPRITLEDALSNQTGLPDHKFSFKPKSASVRDVVRSLRHLPRAAEPGTRYLYSSYMFSTVSHAMETMTLMSLGNFMKQNIWQPLGMTRTYWTPAEAMEAKASGTVLARGYAWSEANASFVEEPVPDFPAVSGAGAIISNVVDYAKWLQCMMTQSPPISPAAHTTLTTPRISFSAPGNNPFPVPHSYALGWFIDHYRGERIVWHSGGWTGFGTTAMYLPDRQWGLVMMGNTRGSSHCVQTALYMGMLDDLLGTPEDERVDWNIELQERLFQRRSDIAHSPETLYPSLPCRGCSPPLPYQSYAGDYIHAGYGDLVLECRGDSLFASRLAQEIPMVIRMVHVCKESWLATLMTLNEDPRDHLVKDAQRLDRGTLRTI